MACAGCYPTATSLAAAPAVRAGLAAPDGVVVVDAISGVTGAGKKASARTHFCFADENLEAYGVATHRHTPEIEQILGLEGRLVFTPHLAPLNRGLLSTVNVPLAADAPSDAGEIVELYRAFYRDDPFVHVLDAGAMPRTSSVAGTNYAHMGLAVNQAAPACSWPWRHRQPGEGRGQPGHAMRERGAGLAPDPRARTDLRVAPLRPSCEPRAIHDEKPARPSNIERSRYACDQPLALRGGAQRSLRAERRRDHRARFPRVRRLRGLP